MKLCIILHKIQKHYRSNQASEWQLLRYTDQLLDGVLPSIAHKGFRCGCTKGDQSSLLETPGDCQWSDKYHVNTSPGRESSSIQVLNLSSALTHRVAWHVRLSKYSVILRQERREADVKSVLVAGGLGIGWREWTRLQKIGSDKTRNGVIKDVGHTGCRLEKVEGGRSDIAYTWP